MASTIDAKSFFESLWQCKTQESPSDLKGNHLWLMKLWNISHQNGVSFIDWFAHLNGFSSVWRRLCTATHRFSVNPFPQMSHLKGLSPVCFLKCLARFILVVNILLQTSHLKGSPSPCIRQWAVTKTWFRENEEWRLFEGMRKSTFEIKMQIWFWFDWITQTKFLIKHQGWQLSCI